MHGGDYCTDKRASDDAADVDHANEDSNAIKAALERCRFNAGRPRPIARSERSQSVTDKD